MIFLYSLPIVNISYNPYGVLTKKIYLYILMELAIRDHIIFQMKEELKNRKKMLCMKRAQLKQTVHDNEMLKHVLEDYEKYNAHMINQKRQQMANLEQLNSYITNITNELILSDNLLQESNIERREILREITKLKEEIDELAEND